MSIGVAGGIFRDAFDAAADDERSGGILAVRFAYGSKAADRVGLSYVAAFDYGVSHDVGRHDGTSYIVSGYSWNVVSAGIEAARWAGGTRINAGIRLGVASRYRTKEGEVGTPLSLSAGTMASRRRFGPVAGVSVGAAFPLDGRLQLATEAVAYGVRVDGRTEVLPAVMVGVAWRP